MPELKASVDELVAHHESELEALGPDVADGPSSDGLVLDPTQPDPQYAAVAKVNLKAFVNVFRSEVLLYLVQLSCKRSPKFEPKVH